MLLYITPLKMCEHWKIWPSLILPTTTIENFVLVSNCPSVTKRCVVSWKRLATHGLCNSAHRVLLAVSGLILKEKVLQLFHSMYSESSDQSFLASSECSFLNTGSQPFFYKENCCQ